MYSRFYRGVLNGNAYVEAVQSSVSAYWETGLFSCHVTTSRGSAQEALEILASELLDVASHINAVEFERARLDQYCKIYFQNCFRNQLKSSIFMNLEVRGIAADDMARQVENNYQLFFFLLTQFTVFSLRKKTFPNRNIKEDRGSNYSANEIIHCPSIIFRANPNIIC
jgi:hypothetical protein